MTNFRLTQNFTLREFTDSSQHPEFNEGNFNSAMNPANLARGYSLAILLEEVRAILDCPLQVGAGFRGKGLNKAVGGVKTSQHLMFEAGDVTPMRDEKNTYESMSLDLDKILMRFAERELMFGQLIMEVSFDPLENDIDYWFHISLGHPFRELDKCREVLLNDNGKWEKVAQLSTSSWEL